MSPSLASPKCHLSPRHRAALDRPTRNLSSVVGKWIRFNTSWWLSDSFRFQRGNRRIITEPEISCRPPPSSLACQLLARCTTKLGRKQLQPFSFCSLALPLVESQ